MVDLLSLLSGLLLAVAPAQERTQDAGQEAGQDSTPPVQTEAPRSRLVPGSPLRFTFLEETRLRVTRVASSMNGSSSESDTFHPVTTIVTQRAWTDVIEAKDAAGSGPGRVRRHLEQGDQRVLLEIDERKRPKEGRTAVSHPAEGRTVLFEAPKDGGELVARDASAEPAAERSSWERAMVLTPSGASLLPQEHGDTLAVGATWKVPPSAVARFLDPCGLSLETFPAMPDIEDPDLYARYGQLSLTRARGAEKGEVRATWRGIETDTDGRRFGRIGLSVKLTGSADTTDWMIAQSKPYEMAAIGYGARDARLEVTLEGVGHVLWDMERGHWGEFRLDADVEARFHQDYAFDMRGTEFSGDLDLRFEGKTAFEAMALPVETFPGKRR